LGRAAEKGFKDAERLRRDRDLQLLSEREDFQKLMAKLQAPSPP
jgi:hypothetical protein